MARIEFLTDKMGLFILASRDVGSTQVEIRMMVYSGFDGVLYTELLLTGTNLNDAWNFRVERSGADYNFFRNDVLVFTVSNQVYQDSYDPAVGLGMVEPVFFASMDNIEVLEFVAGPAAPNLLTPADAATRIFTGPLLNWEAVAGATSYAVEIATDAGFTAIVYSASGILETSLQVPAETLDQGTGYFWRARANDD